LRRSENLADAMLKGKGKGKKPTFRTDSGWRKLAEAHNSIGPRIQIPLTYEANLGHIYKRPLP